MIILCQTIKQKTAVFTAVSLIFTKTVLVVSVVKPWPELVALHDYVVVAQTYLVAAALHDDDDVAVAAALHGDDDVVVAAVAAPHDDDGVVVVVALYDDVEEAVVAEVVSQ
jgi:hypothetical protein